MSEATGGMIGCGVEAAALSHERNVFHLRPSRERAFLDAARAAGHAVEGLLEGETLVALARDVLSFARSRGDFAEGFGAASEILYHDRRGERGREGHSSPGRPEAQARATGRVL